MGLLKPKRERLYDFIRKKWVDATPEEIIRQQILRQMVDSFGYPASLIAVEKELSQLASLWQAPAASLPKRRVDIIVFAKNLMPLLMIECKAVNLTPQFAEQVIGYNAFVKAPWLALANGKEVLTGHFDSDSGIHRFEPGLPTFNALS